MTTSIGPDEQMAHFAAWLPDEVELHVAVKHQNGQWFALVMEFDVTGCGDTRADAVRQAFELLMAYLHAYYEDGSTFDDAIRPIPLWLRYRIALESKLARTLRRTMLKVPLTDESTYALPPGLLPRFVAC